MAAAAAPEAAPPWQLTPPHPPPQFATPQPHRQRNPPQFATPQPHRQQNPPQFATPQPHRQQNPPQFATPQPHGQQNSHFPPFPSFDQSTPAQFQSLKSPAFGQPHQKAQATELPFHLLQPPLRQSLIYTKEKVPAEYSTDWEDLDPESQNFLFKIEEQILGHKDASLRLDHCSRLYEPSVSGYSIQLGARQITQELGKISTIMEREKVSVQELLNEVRRISWNTQIAVRSYMVLRSKLCRLKISSNSYLVPVYVFYKGNLKRPSSFMQLTVARFEEHLSMCFGWINELEQLVLKDTDKPSSRSEVSMHSLPIIISNLHHYFVHVAAKVERLHQYVNSMKAAYLADQRRRGDEKDPFLEADRREAVKQETSARRIHPTIHVPSVPQPSTPGAVLFTSSGLPVSSVPQPSSVFTTPLSAASASITSHLRTPSASAPISYLFGSPSSFGSAHNTSPIGASTLPFGPIPAVRSSLFPASSSFSSGARMGTRSGSAGTRNKRK